MSEEDAQAVAGVVREGRLAQGPEVAAFETEVARRVGVPAAAAVSSGTAALELALRALDVGSGAEVIIPTYACDALHHAVTRCGAVPVLADADPLTLTVSAVDAQRRLGPRTRAVVVPHAFGLAADLDAFDALGVPVVEDCAQALGARVGARAAGSLGRLAVCSFYATKLLTTGEGGMVLGPADLVARVRDFREYDERLDLVPRSNAKLTDMQAALGRSQLRRLDAFIARRRAIAAEYRRRLAGLPCRLPPDAGARHVYHRFVVAVAAPLDARIETMRARGVTARRPVFRPLHHALGKALGQALGLEGYPEAERLWATCLSLPCYPALTDGDVAVVAAALEEALGR